MTRVRDEAGISLVELLVAMTLGLLVLGAVLGVFESFARQDRVIQRRSEAQDRARIAVDGMVRALRMPVAASSGALFDRSDAYDVAFLTSDRSAPSTNTPGLMRIRYCLDATAPANGTVFQQTQTWTSATPPAIPADTACPATGWTTTTTAVTGVTNRRAGLDRPVWVPVTATDGGVTTTTGMTTSLWVAVDPSDSTSETNLTSAAALRNANRPPIAAISVTVQQGTTILDASGSTDPEGDPLRYAWTVNGVGSGSGQRLEVPVPRGTNTVKLTVTDSGDLTATATQTVVVT